MEYGAIIKELRSGVYHPIYFLHGEEPYYVDQIDHFIAENALSEDQQGFNQTILYGLDTDLSTIVAEAKRFPMMSDRQVVIVREAHKLKGLTNGDEKDNELLAYLKNPQPSTILVICHKYKKIDGRKKAGKGILAEAKKHGVVFNSEKPKDWKLPDWIIGHIRNDGHNIDPRTAGIIAAHLGNDIGRIHNELEKLYIGIPEKSTITAQMVEDRIGVSKDYNMFEFLDALGKRDKERALRIAIRFGHDQKEHPIQMIIPSLFSYFSKLMNYQWLFSKGKRGDDLARACGVHPFFLKEYKLAAQNYPRASSERAISMIRTADLNSKGYGNVSSDASELLKELTIKLMM
ncbi:MAG: DNA polymerase-3 subunit delta [Bacteroidia bacterium]|jgi:DNA polymerase-3 subunit delta